MKDIANLIRQWLPVTDQATREKLNEELSAIPDAKHRVASLLSQSHMFLG